MIKRTSLAIAYLVGGFAALIAVFLAIMAWRLASGPVSLGFLTPILEEVLSDFHSSFRVRLDDTVLTWDKSSGALDVRLVGARAVGSDDAVIARVPEMSVGLNATALLHGTIAPTEIEVFRPNLRLVRKPDGSFHMALGATQQGSESLFGGVMSAFERPPSPDNPMSYLESIRIVDGTVNLEDQKYGLSWEGSLPEATLRRSPTGFNGDGALSLISAGQQAEFAVTGEYIAAEKKLSAGINFSEFRPAAFAELAPSLEFLGAIDLPVRGTANLLLDGNGEAEEIGFDVLGGVGHLALTDSVARTLGIPAAAQRLAVRGVQLSGTYNTQETAVAIDHLNIDLEPGQTVYLPAPLDHRMPLAAVQGQGRFLGDEQRAELSSLKIDLGGPKIAASATATGLFDKPAAEADITVTNLQTNELARYWPPSVADSAREWCTERLSDGGITEARIKLAAGTTTDDIELTSLTGSMDVKGLTVDYLPPMPKARNASGVGMFDMNSLTLKIAGGEAEGVSVRGGTVKLYNFDKPQEMADIDLMIDGPIPKVMELIDHPPLGYVKAMGLSPGQTGGFSSGRVGLRFPLLDDLPLERLKVSADIKLDQVSITKIALGADVTNGQLAIVLDEKGMDVTGSVVVEKTPAKIEWRENFEAGAPFDTRLTVDIGSTDVSLLRDLKFEVTPLVENHVKGPLGVNVLYIAYPGDEDSVQIKVDGKRADIDFPYFGWKKTQGIPATGEFIATLRNGQLTEVSSFALKSQGLDVQGGIRYTDGGIVESAKLNRIAVGRTKMEGTLKALRDGGWDIVLGGSSLDIGPLIEELQQPKTGGQPGTLEQMPLTIAMDLDAVWIDPKHPLKDVSGKIVRDQDLWNLVQIQARVGDGSPLDLRITPGKSQSRALQVRSRNAGDTFRALGVLEQLIGGELKIDGTFNDNIPGNPLTGRVKVKDFRVVQAPGIAKLLSIMALTGILDQLRGQGIRFSILDVPFTLHNDAIEIRDARASGTEIGMTAEGRVADNTLNIRGTIVPFYAVNSLLGRIPIVGSIFRGGEKGGGLLAARYSMAGPMNDPDVSVNPLSMLTPSFLRNLFNVFDSDSGSGSNDEAPPREPEPEHP